MLTKTSPDAVLKSAEALIDSSAQDVTTPLQVGGHRLSSRVLLAPLSGITDVPFRKMVRGFGVGLAFSEMIASGEYLRATDESLRRSLGDGHDLQAVQLAGRDPDTMRDAAARLAADGIDVVDVNFGCPAKKVTGGLCGSALMREPDLALRILEATLEGASGVPVTVKMRLGWDRDSLNASELASRAEAAGVAMVTVHGRTRQQFYAGSADWHGIAGIGTRLSIPLIANGDLVEFEDVAPMLRRSGADGVMVGRGACGRPWFPALLGGHLAMRDLAGIELRSLVSEHYEAMLSFYGIAKGLRHARKHLGWYLDTFETAFEVSVACDRAALLQSVDPAAVLAAIARLFGSVDIESVEEGRCTFRSRKAA